MENIISITNNILSDKLVSVETAKLARVKGFHGEVTRWLHTHKQSDGKIEFQKVIDLETYRWASRNEADRIANENDDTYITDDYLPIPTQSLLQRWLREKHSLLPMVFAKWYNHKITGYSLTLHNTYYKEHYNSYEDALEVGLTEALLRLPTLILPKV